MSEWACVNGFCGKYIVYRTGKIKAVNLMRIQFRFINMGWMANLSNLGTRFRMLPEPLNAIHRKLSIRFQEEQ